jgi:hypothetical protein
MSAPTVDASGTQTMTVGVEHTLRTTVAAGTFQLWLDIAAMQAGDTVEVRAKTNILAAGTVRVIYAQTFSGAAPADDAIELSIPLPADQPVTFTIKQTAGTSRSVPWKTLSLA